MALVRLLIVALLFAVGQVVAGPFEDGLAAFDRQDYRTVERPDQDPEFRRVLIALVAAKQCARNRSRDGASYSA
jgi:hypothetical protein